MKHKKEPEPELKNECNQCKDTFLDEQSFETHIKSNHNLEPFRCESCSLVLANFTLLQEHMQHVHTSLQKSCRYCAYKATSEESLETHLIEVHEDKVILHTQESRLMS